MRIHQYNYQIQGGIAYAHPVSADANNSGKVESYHSPKSLPCESSTELTAAITELLPSLKKHTPITTKAHLLVAHVKDTSLAVPDDKYWFSIAEAIVRQEKSGGASHEHVVAWEGWLEATWPSIEVPSSIKPLFKDCANGLEALALLREPQTPKLATICMLASTEAPVTAQGESKPRSPLRMSVNWSERAKSMSFRAVYPVKDKMRMNLSIEELVFDSHTSNVFKLGGRWTEKDNLARVSRVEMQEREFLKLSHLLEPKKEDIQSAFQFLRDYCGYTLEEVLTNELPNIEKKNGVLTRKIFEVLLGAEWKNIQAQIELLRATEHPPELIASALVEGFTQHVIKTDDTGKLDLPDLPSFF